MQDALDHSQSTRTEQEAIAFAEEQREKAWQLPSFLAGLFAGKCQWSLICPYPEQSPEDEKVGDEFNKKLEHILKTHLNPDEVDSTGELPQAFIKQLADLGCFGMKIPKQYGGLGLSQVNYNRPIQLVSSYCGSTAVWLSAHQSIGVPQPLMMFGTDEQKKKYLPQFAKGAISAFALTEPDVGSDPANMSTTARPTEDGSSYIINGEKLWCTNGPVADILIVMAKTEDPNSPSTKKKITAFIVEKGMPGFETTHRCQFMGLRGIQNGMLRFKNVKVPKENILWGIGKGLKLALVTLNTGRLTLPAGCTGEAKWCLKVSRDWSAKRSQWGAPIGQHDAIAAKLSNMASNIFGMESVTWLSSAMADQKKNDIRLEAAMAKLYCTEASWKITDDAVQIRGGRGYESAPSLRGRGEEGIPLERAMRDMRINLIIEGTSEIMHLFIGREAMDNHLKFILPLLKPGVPVGTKIKTMLRAFGYYLRWYPTLYFFWRGPKLPFKPHPRLKKHFKYVHKTSRRLGRALFHTMGKYQRKLERRQRVVFRLVDIGCHLFVLSASCSRAAMLLQKNPQDESCLALVDELARNSKNDINKLFKDLKKHHDKESYRIARSVLQGEYSWLEKGIMS